MSVRFLRLKKLANKSTAFQAISLIFPPLYPIRKVMPISDQKWGVEGRYEPEKGTQTHG